MELGERPAEVRDVVEDGVSEDEVEALVGERQALGLGADRLDLESQPLGRRAQRRQHPGRDVGCRRALDRPELQQVEREVAGAGADLERVGERRRGRAPQRLLELRRTCPWPTGP